MGEGLTLQIPSLYPPQIEFCKATTRYVGYGGSRGGGKSFVARIKASLLSANYPGIQILLLRRTFPELQENHILPLQKLLKGVAEYKVADKVFIFPNGSRIKLGYCKAESDVLQYQGQSYDVIFLEEATQFTEFQFQTFTECNRLSGNIPVQYGFTPRMYFTANPGGVGHNWFKRLFIDKNYRNKEKAEDYTFIRASVYDNKFLMENDPNYVEALENLPEKRRAAMLYGDWDVFEGQMFEEFNRTIHVIDPFTIPNDWRIYRTRDYGLDMTAVLWIALDHRDNAYVFKELHQPNLIVSEAGHKINEMTTEPIFCDLAPPDLWNRHSDTGKSAVDIFRDECGHYLTKANNDRVNGWLAVKEWLKCIKDYDGVVHPKLRIFKNCTNLIRCLPLLQYDAKNPNDASTEPHEITHITDALRYWCLSWTYPPVKPETIRKRVEREWALSKDEDENEGSYMQW